jgi:hypothetical protein
LNGQIEQVDLPVDHVDHVEVIGQQMLSPATTRASSPLGARDFLKSATNEQYFYCEDNE